jgi:hypothetical protein
MLASGASPIGGPMPRKDPSKLFVKEKECAKCGHVKAIQHFSVSNSAVEKYKPGRWQSYCKLCHRAQRSSPNWKKMARNAYVKRKYGIDLAVQDRMEQEQGGLCWICLKPPGARRLSVDHDHKTGRVRGLLCLRCNRYLVGRHRDGALLRRAADYLDRDYDARDYLGKEET